MDKTRLAKLEAMMRKNDPGPGQQYRDLSIFGKEVEAAVIQALLDCGAIRKR